MVIIIYILPLSCQDQVLSVHDWLSQLRCVVSVLLNFVEKICTTCFQPTSHFSWDTRDYQDGGATHSREVFNAMIVENPNDCMILSHTAILKHDCRVMEVISHTAFASVCELAFMSKSSLEVYPDGKGLVKLRTCIWCVWLLQMDFCISSGSDLCRDGNSEKRQHLHGHAAAHGVSSHQHQPCQSRLFRQKLWLQCQR